VSSLSMRISASIIKALTHHRKQKLLTLAAHDLEGGDDRSSNSDNLADFDDDAAEGDGADDGDDDGADGRRVSDGSTGASRDAQPAARTSRQLLLWRLNYDAVEEFAVPDVFSCKVYAPSIFARIREQVGSSPRAAMACCCCWWCDDFRRWHGP
jgi:hypothetical protein